MEESRSGPFICGVSNTQTIPLCLLQDFTWFENGIVGIVERSCGCHEETHLAETIEAEPFFCESSVRLSQDSGLSQDLGSNSNFTKLGVAAHCQRIHRCVMSHSHYCDPVAYV